MKKKVLFLCVGNSFRSQIAEGFARHHGEAALEVRSGGSAPSGSVHPLGIQLMREKGIDISNQKSGPIDTDFAVHADLIVTLCAEADEACPGALFKKVEPWHQPDPVGRSMEEARRVRDEIERRVLALVARIGTGQG
ncbi:MAG: arsenate reductase ArsC [Methanobacteriota archaeon]